MTDGASSLQRRAFGGWGAEGVPLCTGEGGGGGLESTWPLKNCVKTIIAGTLKHVNTVMNSRYYKH